MNIPTSKRQKIRQKIQSVVLSADVFGKSSEFSQNSIPQPPLRPILGNIPDMDPEVPVQSLMKLAGEYGPIYRLEFPTKSMLVISSHELVEEISDTERFEKMVHGPLIEIRDLAGDALFTAHTHEPNWGKAHRILMPAFSPVTVRGYFDAMVDVAEQMLTKWARLGPEVALDVADNMTRLTLDTIALCGFDYRFNSFYQHEMHPFVDAMVRALAEAGARARRLPLQTRLMLLTRRQYADDIRFMNQIVDEVIAERRLMPATERPKDLLGLMLEGRDPVTGEGLDDVNIRQQIVTFLVAGHETTSGLLSFAIHLLLEHPEVLARAQAEADEVLGNDTPRFEHMAKLGYIDQILRETLRLWPTAPAYALFPKEDTVIGGQYAVQSGEELLVLLPTLHRDRSVWGDDVEQFDPDRFAPDRIDRIPPNAWKPFGHGQRACIGRPFAMQEATLVLAMMLRRFHISGVGSYKLNVKETLTLKPEGLQIRAKARMKLRQVTVPQHFAIQPGGLEFIEQATSANTQPASDAYHHATPMLVLYGSNTGSAGMFARRIADDAVRRGWDCKIASLDDYTDKLPTQGAVVIVTASYNGFPPDNAAKFCAWLDTLPADALAGVRFAVFGCGDRDWAATYQAIPRRIDEGLRRAGATYLIERGEADARSDFFGEFEDWYQTFWPALDATFDVQTGQLEDSGPRYQIERLRQAADLLAKIHNTRPATVLDNRELVDTSSPFGRSKRHLEIELPPELTYAVGDYLTILPENDPERVARACQHFGFAPDDFVRLSKPENPTANNALPTDSPVRVADLLSRYVDLGQPATRRDITRLLTRTACPPEQQMLKKYVEQSDAYRTEILERRVSLLELLEQLPSCALDFADFLDMLSPMRPRQYSISSSPLHEPTRCTLTVSVLDAPAWSGNGQYRGACSNYLARLQPGARIHIALRSPNHAFYPPEDPATPLILIAAGSGIAPFRGFIQNRAYQQATQKTAPIALFFGCDHPEVDFLYRDELNDWEKNGVVEVYPAFSQHPAGHDQEIYFVQHRLWAERARVLELLAAGAHLFVCGDGSKMAPAVRETLVRIHQQHTQCTSAEAESWLQTLAEQQRFLTDVF